MSDEPEAIRDDGIALLPEGEHAERAARRVVQWEMESVWRRPGLIGFVLMSVWILPIGAGGFEGEWEKFFAVFTAGLGFVWGLVLLGVFRGQLAFARSGREKIIACYSIEAIRARRRRENGVVLIVGGLLLVLSSALLVVLGTDPRFEHLGGFGDHALTDMLVVVWLFSMLVLLAQFVVCRRGTSDAEIEDHRRKVLGEDWFPG